MNNLLTQVTKSLLIVALVAVPLCSYGMESSHSFGMYNKPFSSKEIKKDKKQAKKEKIRKENPPLVYMSDLQRKTFDIYSVHGLASVVTNNHKQALEYLDKQQYNEARKYAEGLTIQGLDMHAAAEGFYILGAVALQEKEYDLAIAHLKDGIKTIDEYAQNKKEIADTIDMKISALSICGDCYFKQACTEKNFGSKVTDLINAKKNYNDAYKHALSVEQKTEITIERIDTIKSNYKEILVYIDDTLEQWLGDIRKDTVTNSYCYTQIGKLYIDLQNYTKALALANELLESKMVSEEKRQAFVLDIGNHAAQQADQYFTQALENSNITTCLEYLLSATDALVYAHQCFGLIKNEKRTADMETELRDGILKYLNGILNGITIDQPTSDIYDKIKTKIDTTLKTHVTMRTKK